MPRDQACSTCGIRSAPIGVAHDTFPAEARERFDAAFARDTKIVRDTIDAAMREWVARGDVASNAFSEACNAKPRDEAKIKEAWMPLSESHEDECAAHNEGLHCCLNHEHKKYGPMLDFVAAKVLTVLMPLPGWTCVCGCFNGTMKQEQQVCRGCGKEKS